MKDNIVYLPEDFMANAVDRIQKYVDYLWEDVKEVDEQIAIVERTLSKTDDREETAELIERRNDLKETRSYLYRIIAIESARLDLRYERNEGRYQ